jgi:hypothetical protein
VFYVAMATWAPRARPSHQPHGMGAHPLPRTGGSHTCVVPTCHSANA